MKNFKKYLPYILLAIIFIVGFVVWRIIYISSQDNIYLKVVFLDVGQGDAIYIEAPNGKQILVDGGPDAQILKRLAEVMPFGDRSIDMILTTHGDMDHIGGLSLVLDRYKVSSFIENGISSDSKVYKELEEDIIKEKAKKIIAKRGMRIVLDLDKNIYLDILYPDRDVTKQDSNDGSVVCKLVYGNESFMLTGDATTYVENAIGWNETGATLHSQVLKLGHHGSKTSSSELWLEKVKPQIAIISVDENNNYGHPHKETLDKLNKLNIPYLLTYKEGNIIFETDGVSLAQKKR